MNKHIKNWLWFYIYGTIFATLCSIYLISHFVVSNKGEYVNISVHDVTSIQNIVENINNDSSINKKQDTIHSAVLSLITHRYEIVPEYRQRLETEIRSYASTGYSFEFLSQTRLQVKSFFWLSGNYIYWEIIFWTLFGVLCNLFYHVSEAKRKGIYRKEESYVHFSKLMYAPLISIVIYLSIDNILGTQNNSTSEHKNSLLVLSFVLGFFTGRTIELLNRLKDLILPGAVPKKDNPVEAQLLSQDSKSFGELSHEQQYEILSDAINEKADEWLCNFRNFIGSVSVAKKITGGEETDLYCIAFEVTTKTEDFEENGLIPPTIPYKGYKLPTDIILEDIAEASTGSPGSGIKREGSSTYGTLGLKVFREKNNGEKEYFLLSCYHVLCPKELSNSVTHVTNGEKLQDSAVYLKETDTVIAKLSEGYLSNEGDVAIAKLLNDELIANEVEGKAINGKCELSETYVKYGKPIYMHGKVSGKIKGKAKNLNCNKTIFYQERTKSQNIRGLIKTSKMADFGDSGSIVTNKEKVVGIVIASSKNFTYILPIYRILNYLNVNF